jgi:hypothetical protein
MKESHFDHANREKPMIGTTINKSALPQYASPAKANPAESNAFRLKNSQLSLGMRGQPTSYVTTNTLKQKWNQPTGQSIGFSAGK